MVEIIKTLIDKMPWWVLLILIAGLAALFLTGKVRRNKQGKFYVFSQKYEDKKVNNKLTKLLDISTDLSRDMKELQFVSVNLPATRKRLAYIEYKKMGYNSWADEWVVSNGLFTADEVYHLQEQFKHDKELKRREGDGK